MPFFSPLIETGYNTHTVQEPKWKWTVRFLFDYLQVVESDRTYSDGMKHIAINKVYKKFDGINTLTITNEELNNGSDDEAPQLKDRPQHTQSKSADPNWASPSSSDSPLIECVRSVSILHCDLSPCHLWKCDLKAKGIEYPTRLSKSGAAWQTLRPTFYAWNGLGEFPSLYSWCVCSFFCD